MITTAALPFTEGRLFLVDVNERMCYNSTAVATAPLALNAAAYPRLPLSAFPMLFGNLIFRVGSHLSEERLHPNPWRICSVRFSKVRSRLS